MRTVMAMDGIEKILRNNKQWADEITAKDAKYFEHLAEGQSPEYLWIGWLEP